MHFKLSIISISNALKIHRIFFFLMKGKAEPARCWVAW